MTRITTELRVGSRIWETTGTTVGRDVLRKNIEEVVESIPGFVWVDEIFHLEVTVRSQGGMTVRIKATGAEGEDEIVGSTCEVEVEDGEGREVEEERDVERWKKDAEGLSQLRDTVTKCIIEVATKGRAEDNVER